MSIKEIKSATLYKEYAVEIPYDADGIKDTFLYEILNKFEKIILVSLLTSFFFRFSPKIALGRNFGSSRGQIRNPREILRLFQS